MAQNGQSSGPQIRSFQLNDQGVGDLKNSVNLFRGDMGFSADLISLPGRNNLNLSLSASYGSNVQNQVDRWNLEAPTGILGLGWSLPFDSIVVDHAGTTSLEDNRYALSQGGGNQTLLRSELEWKLLDVGAQFAAELDSGEVSDALRTAFAERGVPLSRETRVETGADGFDWLIFDDGFERVFALRDAGAQIDVLDGGLGFETEIYQFWKICYYPDYERWLMVKEDGISYHFGGLRDDATNHGVQWGVAWGNWIGSSTLAEAGSQRRIAQGWNLIAQTNYWGDAITYTYRAVEQAVGKNGLRYTKASYIDHITDVFGRQVTFNYAAKEYDSESPAGPREYMDPHKPIPDNQPNAFQDRYETEYLDHMQVLDRTGAPMLEIRFSYRLANATTNPSDDPLYGDTVKRYLTGITQVNREGDSLPGMVFDYFDEAEAEHPGALETITYPDGGRATYTYTRKDLPITEKSLSIPRPGGDFSADWVPRVWFGNDYAVVAWFNTETAKLRVDVYTWLGYWFPWQASETEDVTGLRLETLQVVAGAEAFAVTYEQDDAVAPTAVLLYHRTPNAQGTWQYLGRELRFASTRTPPVGGKDFFLVLDEDAGALFRYSWNWRTKDWAEARFDLATDFGGDTDRYRYYLTAGASFYLVLRYDRNGETGNRDSALSLFYQNGLGDWQTGGTRMLPDLFITSSGSGPNFYWMPGTNFVAGAAVTFANENRTDYTLWMFHWDRDYVFDQQFDFPRSVDVPIGFIPIVSPSGLIASGPHLFRYNGRDWIDKSIEPGLSVTTRNLYWFGNGNDLTLLTQNTADRIITTLAVYDPDTDSLVWVTPDRDLANLSRNNDPDQWPPFSTTRYFPTAGVDTITVDKQVYTRGTSNDWVAATAQPTYVIPVDEAVDTTTIQNQGPSFIAYLTLADQGGEFTPHETKVVNLQNGRFLDVETFGEQMFRIYDGTGHPKPRTSGKAPTGPNSLFTFPIGEDLDKASHITLRRYLQGTVDGTIADYAVTLLTVEDGEARAGEGNNGVDMPKQICYDYDYDSAAPDPTGTTIKHFRAFVYPGCARKEEVRCGFAEVTYINGLPHGTAKVALTAESDFDNSRTGYTVLDGFLQRQDSYAQADPADTPVLTGSVLKEYRVETHALDPNSASGLAEGLDELPESVRPLRGYRVVQRRETKIQDGVEAIKTSFYDPASGQLVQERMDNVNGRGETELLVKKIVYAHAKYEELLSLNLLGIQAQSLGLIRVGDEEAMTVTQSSATRMGPWQRQQADPSLPPLTLWDTFETYNWLGGDGSPDFTAWYPDTEPGPDWQRAARALRRDDHGQVIESLDLADRVSSTLYDDAGMREIANFSNAALEEAGYLGFEPYEQGDGWSLEPSGGDWQPFLVSGDAHTGALSLGLSAGTTGDNALTRTFTPSGPDARYLFSGWYKTPSGFSPVDGRDGWTIEMRRGGSIVETVFVPFTDSAGRWSYVSRGIDLASLPAGSGDWTITVAARNGASERVLIDDLRFSAFVGTFAAKVYEPAFDLVTAELGPNMETTRTLYDTFQRPMARCGPDENVIGIQTQYLSRQDSERFTWSAPNSLVQIKGSARGFYSDFRRDGGFADHWTPRSGGDWQVVDDALVYTSSQPGVIELTEPAIEKDYAITVHAACPSTPSGPLGLKVGDALTLSWLPDSATWRLEDHVSGRSYEAETGRPAMPHGWLLLTHGRTLLFYADGAAVFSLVLDGAVSGKPSLFTEGETSFSRVVVSADVTTNVTYTDGAGQTRQTQVLDGETSLISAEIPDDRGKKAVTTKPAQLSPTGEAGLLAYRRDFVTDFDWISGVMHGALSDYYAAEGAGHSDDAGFPYTRTRCEASPMGRAIEQGLPGPDLAIRDLAWTSPEQRHTTKTIYGGNGPDFMPSLPAGRFNKVTTVDPDGNTSVTLTDLAGTTVAQGTLLDPASDKWLQSLSLTEYDNRGGTAITRLPNAFDPPTGSEPEDWEVRVTTNMLGYEIERQAPDTGVTETIYDRSGNPRFTRDQLGREQGFFTYMRYDGLQRTLENGYLEEAWDPARLEELANEPAYPPTPTTWQKRWQYDGNGDDPNAMSRLALVTVNRGDGSDGNSERLRYDVAGNTIRHELVDHAEDVGYPTTYAYDNLGGLRTVRYGDSETDDAVHYRYDQTGDVVGVGTASSESAYAHYAYNADGSVAEQGFGGGADTVRRFAYNSPGWRTSISDAYTSQRLYYTRDSNGGPGYFNGRVAQTDYGFEQAVPGQVTPAYSYRYNYDPAGRVTVAAASRDGDPVPDWSLGSENAPVTYDANGNFLAVKQGERLADYRYHPGSDEVMNTDGSDRVDYDYDAVGGLTLDRARAIEAIYYNRVTRLPREVAGPDGVTRFIYDGDNRRIRKAGPSGEKTYVHGLNQLPLVERQATDGSVSDLRKYVYGLGGALLGYIRDGKLTVVLSDNIGSSRAVVGEDGQIAAGFNYLPFGKILEGSDDAVIDYLFTGQELDRDTGLYNFRARLYDADLGRFTSTDPKAQFASPYVYVGNNPIMFIDPSGEWSMGNTIGVVVGVAAIGLGVVAIVATGGALAPVVGAVGAAMIGGAIGGAVIGAGVSSLVYSVSTDDWNVQEWGVQVIAGGVTGAVTGALGVGIGTVATSVLGGVGGGFVTGAATGLVGGMVSQASTNLLSNAILETDYAWNDNLGRAALSGLITGGIAGGVAGGVGTLAKYAKRIKAASFTLDGSARANFNNAGRGQHFFGVKGGRSLHLGAQDLNGVGAGMPQYRVGAGDYPAITIRNGGHRQLLGQIGNEGLDTADSMGFFVTKTGQNRAAYPSFRSGLNNPRTLALGDEMAIKRGFYQAGINDSNGPMSQRYMLWASR